MLKRELIIEKWLIIIFLALPLLIGCDRVDYKSGSVISADKKIDIGKIQNIASKKGFTCTGLSYNDKENVFYVGNIGALTPKNKIQSSIEVVSGDLLNWLGRIDVSSLSNSIKDIQGITYDSSSETIWFCSFSENLIYNISREGDYLSSFVVDKPTGLLYDPNTDSLWVLTYSNIFNYSKSGVKTKSYKVKIKGQDQMCFGNDGNIYFTAGINYQNPNYVFKFDLRSENISLAYTLLDSYAVEGIFIIIRCLQTG